MWLKAGKVALAQQAVAKPKVPDHLEVPSGRLEEAYLMRMIWTFLRWSSSGLSSADRAGRAQIHTQPPCLHDHGRRVYLEQLAFFPLFKQMATV